MLESMPDRLMDTAIVHGEKGHQASEEIMPPLVARIAVGVLTSVLRRGGFLFGWRLLLPGSPKDPTAGGREPLFGMQP